MPSRAPKKESDVKTFVKSVLKGYGERCWYFMPVQTGYGVSGIPDFIVCIDGVFFGIETKFGNNKPTAWQVKQGDAITAAKGHWAVINEQNMDKLQSWLNAILALEGCYRG